MSEESVLVAEQTDEETGTDADTAEHDDVDTTHLDDVEAGAGCTEIWEHLSERREQAGSD
jgi:hypothetical protein